jgi:hypothetical protein
VSVAQHDASVAQHGARVAQHGASVAQHGASVAQHGVSVAQHVASGPQNVAIGPQTPPAAIANGNIAAMGGNKAQTTPPSRGAAGGDGLFVWLFVCLFVIENPMVASGLHLA